MHILKSLLIMLLLPSTIFKAQEYIRFNHLTTDNGLSNNAVTCIFQDSKGFMWFGTQDGLNRYDGYNFKVFKNDPEGKNTLTENFIFSLYENPDSNLYVQTQSGQFHIYNSLDETFTNVSPDSIDLTNAKMNSILALFNDDNDITWSGGLSNPVGLTMTNNQTGETKNYKHDPNDPTSLSDDRVYSVIRDSKGNLWISTFNGLDKLNAQTDRFEHYKKNETDPNSLSDNWVWPVFEDSKEQLWIGTVRSGLHKFDPINEKFTNYRNDPDDPGSLNDNFIFSIYEDRSGIIWVGTNAGGVNYFQPELQVFEYYKEDKSTANSLSNSDVLSVYADQDGIYWIGSREGGLDRFDYRTKRFKNYSHNPAAANSLVNNSVQVIFEDSEGILWLGTFSEGLDAFNPRTEKFTHYTANPNVPTSISDNRIYTITEDDEGTIWIGTYSGGLNKFDKSTSTFKSYKQIASDSLSISSNSIWAIETDNVDNLWVGTFGGGLNYFDKRTDEFRKYESIPGNPNSIVSNNIISIFRDSRDNIWIGTTGGLSKYLSDGDRFKNYRTKDGLPNDMIFGMVEDYRGNLWISTNNGISKFSPDSETFENYFYHDGLQGNEFNQNAYAKDPMTGRLLFGGPNGLNIFHPDSVKENDFIPPVVFTNYLRYNTDVEEGRPIIERGISERKNIALTYKDNIITLQFAALSYYNNFMNNYRYKLEGFNENWIQLDDNHTVTFTNLSPGDYELRVIGSNNDGKWNTKGAALSIEVSPPWWKSKPAYAFYAFTFLVILLGIRKFENDRREQKARIRESELRIKATEAEKRALQIENERKTKELEEARQLQLSMLPKELPEAENLDIGVFMRTATEVGGDYYDFIMNKNSGVLNIAFGDATGHGLQAGTMVTLMKGFFTSYGADSEIKSFFERSTRTIKEVKLGRILMAFTFAKIENSTISMSSAGMPPVYYYNGSTQTVEEIRIKGVPLGAMSKILSFNQVDKNLVSGDAFLFITDGIPEQLNENQEMYEYQRVQEIFHEHINKSSQDIIEEMVKSVDEWRGQTIQEDDITLMIIKVK